MNLVKWLRKNNKKVMAVVVIVIMLGFVAGPALRYLGRRATAPRETVACFADNRKITNYDLALAHRELEILNLLQADVLLKSISVPLFSGHDLHALLLGELLFSKRETSPILITRIKQTIRANRYRISSKQINDIYRRSMPANVYWLLLKNEAQMAGVRTSNENAGRQLARLIPRLFNGAAYSQLIGSIVNRQSIPEKEILATFGKLLAVLEYARTVCTTGAVTRSQIMHNVSWENETIDAEFVRFDSAVFAEAQDEPTQQQISAHFDKYKGFFPGDVSDRNPYGFGYKLPDRVRLEYIALKLDDISKIVTLPTPQQTEEYYQKHRQQFTVSVPSDPNDTNSPRIEQTKSYAEVAGIISNQLLTNKINSRAETILREARTLTEAGLQDDIEPENLSTEQLAQMAGDYQTAAEKLSKKYKIKLYTGRTGLLSADDIRADENLPMLYLKGHGGTPVPLSRIVFAVDELGPGELGPFDVPKPAMYENIGPLKDITTQITGRTTDRIMAIVRVIQAVKASEPETINQTFSTATLRLDENHRQSEDIYIVREKVVEDLKKLAAMDTVKSKAEEFIELAEKNGWENTVEKFNELYGRRDEQSQRDPNLNQNEIKDIREPFKLQNLTNLQRISSMALRTLAVQNAGSPHTQFLLNEAEKRKRLINRLYSLVPQDSNTIDAVPLVLESKPDMSCYCIKSISVKRLNQQDYEQSKAMQVFREDFIQSQSLAPVHFNPENILKRMNFTPLAEKKKAADAGTPAESKGKP